MQNRSCNTQACPGMCRCGQQRTALQRSVANWKFSEFHAYNMMHHVFDLIFALREGMEM